MKLFHRMESILSRTIKPWPRVENRKKKKKRKKGRMNYRCVFSVSFSFLFFPFFFFTQICEISTDFMIIFVKPVLSPNAGRSMCMCVWVIDSDGYHQRYLCLRVCSLSLFFFIRLFYRVLARHASRTENEKDESLWDRNVDLEAPLSSSYCNGEIAMEWNLILDWKNH